MKNNPYAAVLESLILRNEETKKSWSPERIKHIVAENLLVIDAVRTTAALEELRGEPGSGDSVTVDCDNEEAESTDYQCKVECFAEWTRWQTRAFTGKTVLAALEVAVEYKRQNEGKNK